MFIDLIPYIGIPYVEKGRDPADGLDCWGLLRWFYQREFGIELPTYTEQPSGCDKAVAGVVLDEIRRSWIEAPDPCAGDAVVVTVARRPFHVGVYLGQQRMLHTMSAGQGSVIETLSSPKWVHRIEGYYRHV